MKGKYSKSKFFKYYYYKNPLKVLHCKLEYAGKEEGMSFVGMSDYTLDIAKLNRALLLSVPDSDMKLDELINTSGNIVESSSEKIKNKNTKEPYQQSFDDIDKSDEKNIKFESDTDIQATKIEEDELDGLLVEKSEK